MRDQTDVSRETSGMYVARLEEAVLSTWCQYGEGDWWGWWCGVCDPDWERKLSDARGLNHAPDCIVPTLLEKYPESAD